MLIIVLPSIAHASLTADQAANIVLGQPNLYTGSPNQQSVLNLKDLSAPFSATFDSSGNLWVADSGNNRVLEFKPPFSTNEVAAVVIGQPNMFSSGCATTPTGLCQPFSLAFDPTGNLWISDSANNRVLEYLSSNLITGDGAANVLGEPDMFSSAYATSPTGLYDPSGLAFDPTGNLWISDQGNQRVVEYLSSNLITGDGAANVLGQPNMFTNGCTTTPTGLCYPSGLAFDPTGNLWISDQGNQRVVEYLSSNLITGDGAANVLGEPDMFSSACTLTPTGLCNPQGLTFDPTGNLWISNSGSGVVEYFSSNLITGDGAANILGEPEFGTNGCYFTPTGLCRPEGLTFDPTGNLWISDTGNQRVVEYLSSNLITGSPATIAIGQPNLYTGSPNQHDVLNLKDLSGPYSATFDSSGNLWVADSQNNRVLEFTPPFSTNEVVSVVLGQPDMFSSACTTSPTGLCRAFWPRLRPLRQPLDIRPRQPTSIRIPLIQPNHRGRSSQRPRPARPRNKQRMHHHPHRFMRSYWPRLRPHRQPLDLRIWQQPSSGIPFIKPHHRGRGSQRPRPAGLRKQDMHHHPNKFM